MSRGHSVIAGPRSRNVLAKLTDVALDNAASPWLAGRVAEVGLVVEVYLLRVNFVGALVWRAAFSDRDAGWRFASLGWLGPLELCFAWFANVQLIICVVKMLRGKSPKQPTAVITAQRTQEQRGRATRDSPSSGCNGPQNRFRKGVERGSFIEIPARIESATIAAENLFGWCPTPHPRPHQNNRA